MRENLYEEPNSNRTVLPLVIKYKFTTTKNCAIPVCVSCLLDRSKKRSHGVTKSNALPEKQGYLTIYKYDVGDFVSTDQFIFKTPERFPAGYGLDYLDRCFQGGTIYNDAASGLIWVKNQVFIGANNTVMGKQRLEQWL